MIEKLGLPNMNELTEKLNEIINVVNGLKGRIVDIDDHCDELLKAAKKAATTGSHSDLQAYLALRRKFL